MSLPPELVRRYAALLTQQAAVPEHHRSHYLRWLRYYWDFCHKYACDPNDRNSLPAFEEKLRRIIQSDFQRQPDRQAVSLYHEALTTDLGNA